MTGDVTRVVGRGPLPFELVIVSAILLARELVSGIVLWLLLPTGQGRLLSRAATFLGVDRHTWIDPYSRTALKP